MGATHAATIPAQRHDVQQSLDIEQGSLTRLFAAACAAHGERVALTAAGESTTYDELDELSDRIASGLLERGVRPGQIVAIHLERSAVMIAAMLAVIKTGAAYLPLDTRYPQQRIAETIADASPVAVIGAASSTLSGLPGATLYLRIEDLVQSTQPMIPVASSGEDAAYVIYTSGSTGRPKGVVVTHANVARLFSTTEAFFSFTADDVWTMFHSFAFDFSVWEIWGALLTGGRLVIVPYETSRAPDEFYALLLQEHVTILNQTPSAFALLSQEDKRQASPALRLRVVIFGGEALNPAALKEWFSRHPDNAPRLINMYGITETTVHVTCRAMSAADAHTECESLIGEALPDLELHLLDEHLHPVPAGAEGEICVGGAGVSRGYLNRPHLTAERFVADPFSHAGRKLYRSGDMARRRADGELVYLGRRDGQVKINGFRIELGEIEAALLAHRGVRQAAVTVIAASAGGEMPARLAAYFVAEETIAAGTVSGYLAGRLPAHMLPAFCQQMPALPLNANGKIDRNALPIPDALSRPTHAAHVPSSATSIEQTVAAEWQRVLGISDVPFDDNFFDVGGTSLLLIALRTALQERLARAIPIAWMFEHTTVRALARRLSEPAPVAQMKSAALDQNAQKQREAFARARAQRPAARPAAPKDRRSIA